MKWRKSGNYPEIFTGSDTISAWVLVQLMIAVIILLVGSRMIKMLVKMVRRFLERGKVEAGVVSF